MTRKGGHDRKQLVSAKGSNHSKWPVPPPDSQLPQPLARELFYKTLLWDVTETYFRGTASDQQCQALPAPTAPRERPVHSHDPGTVHAQGGTTQGCRPHQYWRSFSPTEQGKRAGGCMEESTWEGSRICSHTFPGGQHTSHALQNGAS